MFKVSNLRKSFSSHTVLNNVSFEIERGSIVGLIGPSGGGKSVLLKILGGVCQADQGESSWNGAHCECTSLMFQEGALFDSISVFDNVAFPLVDGKVPTMTLPKAQQIEVRRRVDTMLAHVGLSAAADKIPAQLSGGMRRRVSLARALICNPQLLLLDEPTCGLDPVASSVIMQLIVDLHREHRPTTIMVSQDLRRLLPVTNRILALFHGGIVFSGSVSELVASATGELREFVSCRYDLDGSDSDVGQAAAYFVP
ncbi:MAG: ATP-binding cassette domain-containing protein [Deltaproteobacteria bacterium]|nr:ATP-binding cassette domain-containing protein [Deltaproteobacteria bacterium]